MRSLIFAACALLHGLVSAKVIKTSLILSATRGAPDGQCFLQQYFRLSRLICFAIGTERQIYVVNGTTPGPTITATIGDTLIVEVFNKLPVETTLHVSVLFMYPRSCLTYSSVAWHYTEGHYLVGRHARCYAKVIHLRARGCRAMISYATRPKHDTRGRELHCQHDV